MTSTDASIQNSNYIIKAVFFSILIDLLGFTVILPLFPSLMEFYKLRDEGSLYSRMENSVSFFRNSIGIPEAENINSVLFGGMIGSLFSFLQFLNSPLFGAASDRYGRKTMILISLIGSAISYSLWGLSSSFAVFLLSRVLGGISEANVSISTALIADLPSERDRSRGMAAIGIAFSIGFVFGPLLGAWFTKFFINQPYFYAGPAAFSCLITIVDIIFVMYYLPETLPKSKRANSIVDSAQEFTMLINPISLLKFSAVKSLTGKPKGQHLQTLGKVYFLYLFLFSGLEFTLTFLVHHRFNFTQMDQGKMFAALGLMMAFIQGGYIRRRMSGKEHSLASLGMFVLIPSFIVIGFSTSISMLAIGLFLFAFGDESEKGKVMGILRSLGALARATGPLFASSSYWLFGSNLTYMVGGLLIFIPLFLFQRVKRSNKFD